VPDLLTPSFQIEPKRRFVPTGLHQKQTKSIVPAQFRFNKSLLEARFEYAC